MNIQLDLPLFGWLYFWQNDGREKRRIIRKNGIALWVSFMHQFDWLWISIIQFVLNVYIDLDALIDFCAGRLSCFIETAYYELRTTNYLLYFLFFFLCFFADRYKIGWYAYCIWYFRSASTKLTHSCVTLYAHDFYCDSNGITWKCACHHNDTSSFHTIFPHSITL